MNVSAVAIIGGVIIMIGISAAIAALYWPG